MNCLVCNYYRTINCPRYNRAVMRICPKFEYYLGRTSK